ncbi:hypothetical protein, partial [Enterococcus faecium]
ISLLLGALFFPRHTAIEPARHERPRIDGVGIALFAVAMLSLLVFLQNIGIALIWMPVVAVAVGAAFVWWERRVDDPFIDVRVLTTS